MKQITMYSTPTCVFCPAIKQFFKKHDIAFTEIDVSQDEAALEEMKEVSGQLSVPVTVIGDAVIVGYDKKKLQKALES